MLDCNDHIDKSAMSTQTFAVPATGTHSYTVFSDYTSYFTLQDTALCPANSFEITDISGSAYTGTELSINSLTGELTLNAPSSSLFQETIRIKVNSNSNFDVLSNTFLVRTTCQSGSTVISEPPTLPDKFIYEMNGLKP